MTPAKEQTLIFAIGVIVGVQVAPIIHELRHNRPYSVYPQERYTKIADSGFDAGYDYSSDSGKPGYYADPGTGWADTKFKDSYVPHPSHAESEDFISAPSKGGEHGDR